MEAVIRGVLFPVIIRLHAQSSTSTGPGATGRECTRNRAHTSTAERALHAACPGLLHSIRDIPHSSHTCKNTSVGTRCLRCLLLIRTLGLPPQPMPRHLWAKGTSEPFTGQENPRFFCRGKSVILCGLPVPPCGPATSNYGPPGQRLSIKPFGTQHAGGCHLAWKKTQSDIRRFSVV